jgi:hypothetical protein
MMIGSDESYGYWPASGVSGLKDTIMGVPGKVNPGGDDDRDPHHTDKKFDEEFHPNLLKHYT